MTREHMKIAVLEAQWFKQKHTSVRGLFELISNLTLDCPDGFHYETINSKIAARDAITRVGAMRGFGTLYIATHGSSDALDFLSEPSMSRSELVALLMKTQAAPQSSLVAVYLGTCSLGSEKTAEKVLAEKGIQWLAGYDTEVGFMTSSALDMAFLCDLVSIRRPEDKTELEAVAQAAKNLRGHMSGLIDELGFHVWVRKQGSGAKGVRDLMA